MGWTFSFVKAANKCIQNVETLYGFNVARSKYLRMTMTNQNSFLKKLRAN